MNLYLRLLIEIPIALLAIAAYFYFIFWLMTTIDKMELRRVKREGMLSPMDKCPHWSNRRKLISHGEFLVIVCLKCGETVSTPLESAITPL